MKTVYALTKRDTSSGFSHVFVNATSPFTTHLINSSVVAWQLLQV